MQRNYNMRKCGSFGLHNIFVQSAVIIAPYMNSLTELHCDGERRDAMSGNNKFDGVYFFPADRRGCVERVPSETPEE